MISIDRTNLRIVFMGTSDFASVILRSLSLAGYNISCVYTKSSTGGRGKRNPLLSNVRITADEMDLEVRSPLQFDNCDVEFIKSIKPDFIVVAAYGLLLPANILNIPSICCLNVHASLLPKWRGANPIQRAIMSGDKTTGVCIMKVVEALDAGPIFCKKSVEIGDRLTTKTLSDKLAHIGADLLVSSIPRIASEGYQPTPQEEHFTYASKISENESWILWSQKAAIVDCQIRALSPDPGAWFMFKGERIKVLDSIIEHLSPCELCAVPGTVLDNNLLVSCKDSLSQGVGVRLLKLQRSGKLELKAKNFLNGYKIIRSDILI